MTRSGRRALGSIVRGRSPSGGVVTLQGGHKLVSRHRNKPRPSAKRVRKLFDSLLFATGLEGDDDFAAEGTDGNNACSSGGFGRDHRRGAGIHADVQQIHRFAVGFKLPAPGFPDMVGLTQSHGDGNFAESTPGGELFVKDFVHVVRREGNEPCENFSEPSSVHASTSLPYELLSVAGGTYDAPQSMQTFSCPVDSPNKPGRGPLVRVARIRREARCV